MEHSKTGMSGDQVPKPAPSELAEHSTSIGNSVRQSKPEPSERPVPDSTPRGIVGFSDNQTVSEPLEHSRTCISDDPVPESGEAIVVGAIRQCAPSCDLAVAGWYQPIPLP